jgi:HAE1 family hydrophobic/amphiphilic exporter-1
MSITEIAIKRPLLITVIFFTLILFGIISYKSLNYNLLPKFESNVISITTIYPGAAADEVETTVTKKVEDAVSSIEGLDQISSTSQESSSTVSLQLLSGADVNKALEDASRKVDQIISQLPLTAKRPVVDKFSSDATPILRMGVTAAIDQSKLYDILNDQIKPQLSNIPGVGQVNLIGGSKREIKVNLNMEKLQGYKLSVTQVTMAVQNANQSFPTGRIETTNNQYSIHFDAKITQTDVLDNLIVRQNPDGSKVYLRDVADVVDGIEEVTVLNHMNGKPSVGVEIIKQTDANAVNVSRLVQDRTAKLEKAYRAQGLKFSVASDQSTYTLESAHAVIDDLFMAVLIVAFVMLAFLHSIRSSMFILISLPSSMIPTFIGMYLLGFSLNLMTLMALSLVVGILVDDSIVILENIYRHMEMGKDRMVAAVEGRSEIGFTALAITLVDVVVFLPMSFAGGLIGNILKEFALVVVFSTLMSLLVSFTVTPLLASRFGKLEHLTKDTLWGRINLWFEDVLTSIKDFYTVVLTWSLSNKKWVIGLVLVLLAGSVMLLADGFIGAAFIKDGDMGEVSIKLELAPQASVYQTNQMSKRVESLLLARPEVATIFTNVGYSSATMTGSTSSNANIAELDVKLVDKHKRKMSDQEFGNLMKNEILKMPGIKVTVNKVSITGSTADAPIQIAIKGTDMKLIRQTAAMVKKVVESVPGTQYVQYSVKDPKPQVEVKLDREKMADYGLSAYDVGSTLQNSYQGNDDSKFKQNGNEYDILVGLDKFDKTNIEDVRNLTFINSRGQQIQLQQFAAITENMGETVLERKDRLNSIKVNASVLGRPSGTVAADIQKIIATKQLPQGITIEYLGDLKNQNDAFGSLGTALILAIILVYLIMVALYESTIYPFVVLFSIPVALIGALLALALTMESLTIFSIVGLIMLLGLVAKNAILIVDFANHAKEQGMSSRDALIEAGKERLRPILMTTMAMVTGMLPIALATGAGAQVKNGMAWVIIGGLTSSLLLTLVLVPSVYLIVDTLKEKWAAYTFPWNRNKVISAVE